MAEVWARYAGDRRRLLGVCLARRRNLYLSSPRKGNDSAVWKTNVNNDKRAYPVRVESEAVVSWNQVNIYPTSQMIGQPIVLILGR